MLRFCRRSKRDEVLQHVSHSHLYGDPFTSPSVYYFHRGQRTHVLAFPTTGRACNGIKDWSVLQTKV